MDLFTVQEAATYLHLSERTIKHHIRRGDLTPLRRVGRSWLFDKSELDRFAATPRHKGGRPPKSKD